MSTIVGVETDRGVALAADTASVTEGTVGGAVDRVFEFEAAGAAAVGDPGDVATFGRQLRSELDRERLERDRTVDADRVARVAADVAEAAGVEAIVAGRDDGGSARLRTVDSDGAVLETSVAASGTGARIALGLLEDSADRDDDPEERARTVIASVAERDAETGDDVDSYSVESRDEGGSSTA